MASEKRPEPALTEFLADLARAEGDGDAERLRHVLAELRVIAAAHMRSQRPGHTLQPTALVNAAYLKLFDGSERAWKDRGHFFTVAAKAMRHVLVDHARARGRQKRGGGRGPRTLFDAPDARGGDADVLDVHDALVSLAKWDARKAQVVEMRYFGGLEVSEIAGALGLSLSTVEREWRAARAWLAVRLADGDGAR
jgi:RNA polymerase sigma factor (TIGR02999 family)